MCTLTTSLRERSTEFRDMKAPVLSLANVSARFPIQFFSVYMRLFLNYHEAITISLDRLS